MSTPAMEYLYLQILKESKFLHRELTCLYNYKNQPLFSDVVFAKQKFGGGGIQLLTCDAACPHFRQAGPRGLWASLQRKTEYLRATLW
jgi:hypothetical protein